MSTYLPAVLSSMRPDTFDRQIDRMFDEALRMLGTGDREWIPACNAWEDDNGFYVQLALPGWDSKDVSLEVNNQVLGVKGARKEEHPQGERFYHREIGGERFARFFTLPTFVDHDKASATQKNGLLTVAFPKREEARCRRILIEGP